MNRYIPTIGLEIHAELKTKTKMFCNSKNDPDETRPNVNICPICMGHPGVLPTINMEAVRHVLKLGVAIGGELSDFSEFDRKNYFYPDIPKGYQISQYKYPLVKGGNLNGIKITRVHLEEDTATSIHDRGDYSLVDFNRAGVPLLELVTEPVIRNAKEAGDFAREFQLLLRYLGIAKANMEKGEMRVEANISVNDKEGVFGTKVEVKNLNSFRAVERAIAYELERHEHVLESGQRIIQETRGFDENTGETFSQRAKEESHDYRYFPDPDLPKLKISEMPELNSEAIRASLPELPKEKRERYKKAWGLKEEAVEIFVGNPELSNLFEKSSVALDKEGITLLANYLSSDFIGLAKTNKESIEAASLRFISGAQNLASLVTLIRKNLVSSRGAKDVLAVIFKEGGDPEIVAREKGLIQQSDPDALKKVAEEVVKENAKAVEEYKSGKEASLQYLVGQGMKKTRGSANPEMLKSALKAII